MAIALRGVSAALSNPLAAANIVPAVHASAVAGDLSVMVLTGKPFNTSGMAFTGWVPLTGILASGAVANGTDVGSVFVAAWVKEGATAGAVPAPTMTNFNTAQAVIVTFSKAATEVWDYSTWTFGIDSSVGLAYSAAGAAIPTASGDMILAVTGTSTDAVKSTPTLTGMTGSTIGTVVLDMNVLSTTGNDCGLAAVHAPITAGSSAVAPTSALTFTTVSGEGETLFFRLRVGQLVKPAPILRIQSAISRANTW